MYRSTFFLTTALAGTALALVQQMAMAKSAFEVGTIAKSVAVEIKLQQKGSIGSGVIIERKGDIYTLVTNGHVVCGGQRCSELPSGESYSLGLADGQYYKITGSSIKLLGNDLDLAIIRFRSNRNYAVAKLSPPGSLRVTDQVYTAGFPLTQPGFRFGEGKAIAVVNKRLTDDAGGYTVIYDATTLPGMSGGGVYDKNGLLVAIHGQGDRFQENTEVEEQSRIGQKIGVNRGIPVRWLVQGLAEAGINVSVTPSSIRGTRPQISASADEHFVTGFNKLITPGDNVLAGKRLAIQNFSKAIQLNPKYGDAYFQRAYVYEQLQEFPRSLADYSQAIAINPKDAQAHNNRGMLKANNLNDIKGALADYNEAISIDPRDSEAYNNRAVLKRNKLNDIKGALDDYNQAISISPKSAHFYYNRANLKKDKLGDNKGSLTDYNQAISINPNYVKAYTNRGVLKANRLNDIQGALADYKQAIYINPKAIQAYGARASLKAEKLNDLSGALADYNQIILIAPKYSPGYGARANLKANRLNDIQGALADYKQTIALNPKDSDAYYNRAILKRNKLNDFKGALADYNQVISINPKDAQAYGIRGLLKYTKLNDRIGGIADMRQAAKIAKAQGDTEFQQAAITTLKEWNVKE
jgi:tetratricopeptide (TPR) repeat protein/S1-C subfamily serine protease